jgi:sulfoxide reductase catalytic subunit YedY
MLQGDDHFRRYSMKFAPTIVALAAGITTLLLVGCGPSRSARMQAIDPDDSSSLYLQLVDGLHVTGKAVDIDIKTYRLGVTGAVEKPLSLSYDEIKRMPAVREYAVLNCPGFFTDKGTWTGVPIRDILNMSGIKQGAREVSFKSADGSYSASMSLDTVLGDGMLIAYEFEGKPFPKIHGFPLRVVAKDQAGSRWVKWLGEITVK